MSDLTTASLLGISLGNVWLCALLVFALESTDSRILWGYISGRVAGILAFTMGCWLLGRFWVPPRHHLDIASGLLLLSFAAYFGLRHRRGRRPAPETRVPIRSTDCEHDCETCPAHHHETYGGYCEDCDDRDDCSAENRQVEPLTREARSLWGRKIARSAIAGFDGGFTLGLIRGAAMCGRLVVLLPLVLRASLTHALGVGLAFSLTSSIYPLGAMIASKSLVRLVPYRRLLTGVAVLLLTGVGLFYLARGLSR